MSQSRFSIVLVGVSALLRRPLVSRLRPADGERSPWVVFAARGCRFDSGFRSAGWPSGFCFRFSACTASELPSAGWPSGSPLPLFGTHRFGVATRRVGLRAHCFRFSACAASELPLGELAFGLTASAFRHAPLRVALGGLALSPSVSEIAVRRVGLRVHRFRFSARTASEIAAGRVGLRAHCFCFSACAASEIAAGRVGLRAHCFRFSACAVSELPLGELAFGLLLPLFGTHRSAPPYRRREDRRSTPTRHLFHFKTLISTC